jgi:hypothetical protein
MQSQSTSGLTFHKADHLLRADRVVGRLFRLATLVFLIHQIT